MDASAMEVEIFRLKIRVGLIQTLLLQTALFATSETSRPAYRANKQRILQQLEAQGALLEKVFLRGPTGQPDAERPWYADEIREAVEHLKTSLNSFKG
jgi:hypothetical protein